MSDDVFISYAHVDDQALAPDEEGWVTALVKRLQIRLAQKLGRREAFSLWMDQQLSGNEPLTPQILERLRQAKTMIVIHSPGYVASEWCRREFLQMAGGLGSRLFLIERETAERAAELADLRGYRFWLEDSLSHNTRTLGDPLLPADEAPYYALIGDLATDLARELKRQRQPDDPQRPAPLTPAPLAPAPLAPVFLAEVTDDLEPLRDEVRRYLEQQGIRVVPQQVCYPRTAAGAFTQAVDVDLQEASLFVQLLSGVAGKKPADADQTFVQLQYERARAAARPIVQWRAHELDLAAIARTNPSQAALLQGECVVAVTLEELKSDIVARVLAPPKARAARQAGLVFVNAESHDLPVAQRLAELLTQWGAGWVLPLQGGDPAAARADLEQNLLECDKLVIVYGATTPVWVREQLRYARRVLPRRDSDLQALAIYQGPPPPKPGVGFALPNQLTIDGTSGVNESALRSFLGLNGSLP